MPTSTPSHASANSPRGFWSPRVPHRCRSAGACSHHHVQSIAQFQVSLKCRSQRLNILVDAAGRSSKARDLLPMKNRKNGRDQHPVVSQDDAHGWVRVVDPDLHPGGHG
jgi:hypothetical protein